MEEATSNELTTSQIRYALLDKYLLYLIASELGYFFLLILGGVIVSILIFTIDFSVDLYEYETAFLWPFLFYIIVLPLNMIGGFAGIILNIQSKHEGFPGTGHFLNWIFLASTGWIFIIALLFMLPAMAGGY